eukprot:gene12026-16097_t
MLIFFISLALIGSITGFDKVIPFSCKSLIKSSPNCHAYNKIHGSNSSSRSLNHFLKGLTNDVKFDIVTSTIFDANSKFRKAAIHSLSAIIFSCVLIFSSSPSHAAIANLADVGIKEFLVKDGRQLLRLSIPKGEGMMFKDSIESKDLQTAQENLELVRLRFEQVGFTNPAAWGGALKDATTASNLIKTNQKALLSNPKSSQAIFEKLIPQLSTLLDSIRSKDIQSTLSSQEAAAASLGDLRLSILPEKQLPFNIPEEYSSLPALKGRATVEIILENKKGFVDSNGKKTSPRQTILLEVDGYHAPLTAGNFVDLVNKKFFDGLPFSPMTELTAQIGKQTSSSKNNFPLRTVPLELFYKGDKEPTYGVTSDDDLRATETMILPFQAYGAVGMARDNEIPDSGNTEFFMLKWKQALIAPGRNTLDGFYSCFGYVVENENILGQLVEGDSKIVSAKVISGLENLSL